MRLKVDDVSECFRMREALWQAAPPGKPKPQADLMAYLTYVTITHFGLDFDRSPASPED